MGMVSNAMPSSAKLAEGIVSMVAAIIEKTTPTSLGYQRHAAAAWDMTADRMGMKGRGVGVLARGPKSPGRRCRRGGHVTIATIG